MAKEQKKWESFEDAFRSIITEHKAFFDLERVEPGPGKVKSESGYVYDIEVVAHAKGDGKTVLFECRRKATRNLEPKDAGEFAFRIDTTGAGKGYFVTTLDKGLSAGAKTIADHAEIGHIQLSCDATPDEYVMKYLGNWFVGVVERLCMHMSVEWEHRDKDGNVISRGTAKG